MGALDGARAAGTLSRREWDYRERQGIQHPEVRPHVEAPRRRTIRPGRNELWTASMEASFEAVGMDGLVFGPRPSVLVSRCLLGIPCRYHGSETVMGRHIGRPALIAKLRLKYELLDICPEVDAGLPTPRPPIILSRGRAICEEKDITVQLLRAAHRILDLARDRKCVAAYLLKTSPTCDPSIGLCGKLLRESGIKTVGV